MSTSNNNSTVVVSVDATGFEAGVNKIKAGAATVTASQDAMAKRAALVDQAMREAAANGFELNARAANKLAAQYQQLADTAGKTQAQILAQRAAATGVTSTFASLGQEIAAASEQTHGFSFATSAAKRELLVLGHELSQGNYKKFGGSLLVLGEQTGAAGLLFSAAGLGAIGLAAGVAAAAYEIFKGASAFDALTKSSAVTNGYIGLTSDQLLQMSRNIAGTSQTITTVQASMTALVNSGQIAADQLSLATKVTAEFAKDTGVEADKAAEALVKFAEDPAKALVTLQSQYHTFSAAQVEVIENYIKTGDTASAFKAILEGLDESHTKFANAANENIGLLAKRWAYWGTVIDDVKNKIANIGVAATSTEKLTDATGNLALAQANYNRALAVGGADSFGAASAKKGLDAANAQIANIKKVQAATEASAAADAARAKQGDATVAAHQFLDSTKYSTPTDKHKQELDDNAKFFAEKTKNLDQNSALYAQAVKKNNDNIAQIDAEYAKKTKTKTASPNAAINALLADISGQNKLIEQEEKRSETTLKAQRDTGLIDNETYLRMLNTLQADALTKEIALAQRRADIAGGKKEKAAQQSYLATVKELTAQREGLDNSLTDSLAKFAAQRSSDIQMYADAESSALRKQQAERQQAYATMFLSPDAKANADAAFQLQQQYYSKLAALQKEFDNPTADQAKYTAEREIAKTFYEAQLGDLRAAQDQQARVRNSYADQLHLAMVQLAGESQSNAQLAASAFTTAWGDASTALDTFVTTGKLSFTSLTESILADLAKIALHQAESQIFSAVSTSFFSTGGSVGKFATGGNISGPGTGTSDSIPAMLSNGEYVINAASTKKYGSLLDSINSGHLSKFASGGAVGNVTPTGGGNSTTLQMNLNGGNSGLTAADLAALAPQFQQMIDKRLAQRMSGQGGFADMIRNNRI